MSLDQRSQQHFQPPKYSFLAALYLDGRTKPERKITVYLDPADSDFPQPDGKVKFKNRWVQSKNGGWTEHAWVFKDKAIETIFDRLMINNNGTQLEEPDENTLVKAMESSGISHEENSGVEEKGVGQIIVEIKRVVLGDKVCVNDFRASHHEGQEEDTKMDGVKADITHAAGLSYTGTVGPAPVRVVEYTDYRPGEELWATFQFFYRSAGTCIIMYIDKFDTSETQNARCDCA